MRMNRLLSALCLSLVVISHTLYGAPLGSWFAFVGNETSDNVTPIQLATGTGTPQASIPLLITPTTSPVAIAITPDGNTAYVVENNETTSLGGNLVVIDTLTHTVIQDITLSSTSFPNAIAITPNGLTALVVDEGNNEIIPIDTTTNTAGTAISLPAGSVPVDIAITPNGLMAYVVDSFVSRVIPINLATLAIGTPIAVGDEPSSIAITPNGQKAYVTNSFDNTLTVININTQATTTISGITANPVDIAINPAGTRAYVISSNLFVNDNGTFTVIDIASDTILADISEGSNTNPEMLAISPDGLTAYIVNNGPTGMDSTVTPIDISTEPPIRLTPISLAAVGGEGPDSISITPDQAPTASFSSTVATLGTPTLFDASASFSPVGTIAQYAWNFGDNTSIVATTPTVSHTYATAGTFNASLTVTNSAGTSTTQVFTGHMVTNNGGSSATLSQSVFVSSIIPPILPLLPPTHLRGFQKTNKFATQTDYVNILTWKAPTEGASPVAYRIYKNESLTELIATVKAEDRLKFKDHNRKKDHTYTYFIVSVDQTGRQSPAAQIVVHPEK
jgi:YVTN family beta-propeller protein